MTGSPIHADPSLSRQSPLHGRYLATNPALRALLAASDFALAPLRRRPSPAISRPRRVLLCINGHLGDAVIATSAIASLANALPDAEIGVVVPSWSRVVLAGDARIRHVHTLDHWHTSRAGGSRGSKWRNYRRSRRHALSEIRRVRYDSAVDLYDYFPNAALLMWRAGIPVRIGFDAAGFSALYSHAVAWPDDGRHAAERQRMLLGVLLPDMQPAGELRPSLPAVPAESEHRIAGLLAAHGVSPGSFVVLHPGAGTPAKEIAPSRWRYLAERLTADGELVVVTGRGRREKATAQAIARDLPRCIDLCDALDWPEFVQLLRLARAVVSLDSVAGHVAAAVAVPSLTLWTSPASPDHWRPLGASNVVIDGSRPSALDETRAWLARCPSLVP